MTESIFLAWRLGKLGALSIVLGFASIHANELPQPNQLELSPENFCRGIPNVMAYSEQSFDIEIQALCDGTTPTQDFLEILSNPYEGQNNAGRRIQELSSSESLPNQSVQIFIAYAMKVPKRGVEALLAEEGFVENPYSEGILSINASFLEPPRNEGNADTAFSIEQVTNVNRTNNPQVIFNDISQHDLRMYRMHPNNFDFFLAVRTLVEPSEQFRKAVVVRGVMADSENPAASAYIITVLNFIMNSRGDPDGRVGEGMIDTFTDFIVDDMRSVYQAHSQGS